MSVKEIHETLASSGYKLTAPRKRIAGWISNHDGIFSAAEMRSDLKRLDIVSIYRTLELFASLDIIHRVISLHGEQHYELHANPMHHHHIVCTDCERSSCIPCEIPRKSFASFKNIHHSMIFTGLCKPCSD